MTCYLLGGLFGQLCSEKKLVDRGTIAQQVDKLNEDIQEFYETNGIRDRIHEVTANMFMSKSVATEAPHFNPGNMSRVRALVSFAARYATLHCDDRCMQNVLIN